MATIERRISLGRAEVRSVGETRQIAGYGAVFNTETVIADNFRERIAPGAFAGVIAPTADIRSLFNHDANLPLGRTSVGTLRVSEDAHGLRYEVDINADDRAAVDIAARVARGDVTGSSFGFRVKRDEWTRGERAGDLPLRTIHEFAELVDVGPVTFPAYNEATAEARDAAAALRSVVPPVEEAPAPPVVADPADDAMRAADADRARRLRLAQASCAL